MSTKSSAKSSCSSLQSSVLTSSISSKVRSGAKAIKHSVKHIKKGANALIQPLKCAKHVLSNILTLVITDVEDDPTVADDQATVVSSKSPEVIEVGSDDKDLEALKEKLSMPACHSFLTVFLTYFS